MEQKIRHMVIFCLKHEKDSKETKQFLEEGKVILSKVPGVEKFEVFSQISSKNDYDYGFSMEFINRAVYNAYNEHPYHKNFVEKRWKTEVSRFLEIDLVVEWNQ